MYILIAITCLILLLLLGLFYRILQIGTGLQEYRRNTDDLRKNIGEQQLLGMKLLQDSVQSSMADIRSQISLLLNGNTELINNSINRLTSNTDQRLKEISGQVEQKLSEGFAQTNTVFTDVVKRLAVIDEAQKRITDLSSNVVDLQTVLNDKRTRGAFGEVQLSSLVSNIIPENNFSLQHTLSNGKRVDCMLLLPPPSGNIAIDAKFPLESYRKLIEPNLAESEKSALEQQFRADIRKHLQDIAEKYIIPNETADGAVMFIPAEAIFAEIHAHYQDLVDLSHKLRVWMVSPTTMMAVLTTAKAVLKDAATKEQVTLIQKHLGALNLDFSRFQKRMEALAKHIENAHSDLEDVKTSSRKIVSRFNKIERVEFDGAELPCLTDELE
jgi:DNA recombination protein RmuC